MMVVERNKPVGIGCLIEKFYKILPLYDDGCCVDARVKTDGFTFQEIVVQKNMHMMFRIIYQSERSY
jgi:hypothetical protein